MQKKFIALAVAGLVSGAAFAQSNVTVYGVADAYYVSSSGDNVDFSGIQSGGQAGGRIGFKGEEALGNGLKAIFTYEFGTLDISTGTGMATSRQAFVGLSGGFGTAALGRQYMPSFFYLGGSSANSVTVVNPSNLFIPQFYSMNTGNDVSRVNNSISYTSPTMGGFEVRAIYGFGEQNRDGFNDASSDQSRFGLGAKYSNGPVYLTAIYQAQLDDDAIATDEGNQAWAIGGAYDFKVVKLYANYIRENEKRAAGTTTYALPVVATTGLATATTTYAARDLTKKYWSLGLGVPVSAAGTVNLEYSQYKTDAAGDPTAKGFGIGYSHDLSKRTTAYVNLSHINNDDTSALGFNGVGTADDSSTNFAVGMRHMF